MMERDKINRSLLGPTKKVKNDVVANEVNDDIHDDIRTRFSLKFVISISKWYTLLS